MVYMIGYDLRQPGRNYDSLHEAIKSYGLWCHALDSTWLVETGKTAKQILEHLMQHIDSNDALMVIQVLENWYATGLKREIFDWLQKGRNW